MNAGASGLSQDQTKAALRPAGSLAVLLVVLKGLLVVTTLIPPALTGLFVDEVLVGRNADRLWLMLGAFIAVYGVETVLKAVEILMQNRAVHRVVFRQRMRVFRSIQRLPWSELMRHAPGELLKRVEDDSEELGALLLQRIERIFNWCLIVVGGVVCVAMSWQLALAASALTTLLWLVGRWIKRQAGVRSHAHREAMGRWSAWLHESLLGWREVRMLAIENEQSAKMAAWLRRINRLRGASHTFTYLQHAIGRLQEHYVSQATLYFLGGVLIFAGSLTLGGLIAFMRYFARVLDAADRINALNAELGNLQPRLRRSFEVTEWPQIPPPRARLAPAVVPEIELRDVVLAYDGAEPVLSGVDCVIPANSRVAVVGSSGSGKSTIARIVAGQQLPTSGELRIGARRLQPADGMRALGTAILIGQDSVVYNMSLRENLLLARPRSTDGELLAVCADAQLLELVERLPGGLDAVVGERGRQLSAGERQRLILARTMLLDRPILVLDEAMSQLDDPTARSINQKLVGERDHGTVIVIAHRVSTIVDLPRILVLDGGRITADGRHAELLRTSEKYRTLFASEPE